MLGIALIIIEISMLVYGLFALISGTFFISGGRVATGIAARIPGAIMAAALPINLTIGLIWGSNIIRRGGLRAPTDVVQFRVAAFFIELGVTLACLVAAYIMAAVLHDPFAASRKRKMQEEREKRRRKRELKKLEKQSGRAGRRRREEDDEDDDDDRPRRRPRYEDEDDFDDPPRGPRGGDSGRFRAAPDRPGRGGAPPPLPGGPPLDDLEILDDDPPPDRGRG